MKNAHERFGWLEFEKQLKDTRTRLRVALDRFISEPAENKEASGTCHLVSVFGNDVDIGAIWAGLAGQEWVTVSGPDLAQRRVTLGKGLSAAGRAQSSLTTRGTVGANRYGEKPGGDAATRARTRAVGV